MPASGKRRRLSDFEFVSPDGVDVKAPLVIATLVNFREKATAAIDEDHVILDLVDELISKLSQRITFGIMSPDNGPLLVAGIVSDNDHSLIYPPFDPSDVSARAARYREMGAPGTFMTGDVFDQVVDTIETHVCVRTQAGCRTLVDAFLLRVAAMVEDRGRMLLYPAFDVPVTELSGPEGTLTVAGRLDYFVAFLSQSAKIESTAYLMSPSFHLESSERSTGFAVILPTQAVCPVLLEDLPQALLKAAAMAKRQETACMRGVLTNGLEWLFFSFKPGPDGIGGSFECPLQLTADSRDMRAVITGLLKDSIDGTTTAPAPPVPTPPTQSRKMRRL